MQQRKVRTPATTFIVRVWTDDDDDSTMRGEIEHIGSGERKFFDSYGTLFEQIETWRPRVEAVR